MAYEPPVGFRESFTQALNSPLPLWLVVVLLGILLFVVGAKGQA
jgi:hypothetical protein